MVKIALSFLWCLATLTCLNLAASSNLQLLSTCTCLGQNVSYECTVERGAFTVWSGSAFMCQSREISLRHVRFLDAIGDCNNGAIIGKGITISNNSYTSHLYVTLSSELIDRSVNCSLDNGVNFLLIDTKNLSLSTDPFPPPVSVYVDRVRPHEITFSWDTVSHDYCPSFRYHTLGINCGTCSPNITKSNTASCTNFSSTLTSSINICNFTVQSIICENIAGEISYSLITLKVPDVPIVQSVPHYLFRKGSLIRLTTSFKVVRTFNISEDQQIDGSATSYTIIYAELNSGKICNSTTIMASSCEAGMCNHTFEVSSSSCPSSSNIATTVFASNVLGNGRTSNPIATSSQNTFVEVSFDPTMMTIQCSFPNQTMFADRKMCIANITYGPDCDQHLATYSAVGEGSSVTTSTITFNREVPFYCIFVSASNGVNTAIVEGNLDLVNTVINHGQQSTIAATVVPIVVVVISIIATISIVVILLYIIWLKKQVRIIKFKKSEQLSFIDVLQVLQQHDVTILGVNTHSHHADVNLETKLGFNDNYVFCICSEDDKKQLKLELKDIEFFEENSTNQDDNAIVLVKISVRNNPGSMLETMKVFKAHGIKILSINTSIGDDSDINSILCNCSRLIERKIIKAIKEKCSLTLDVIPARELKPKNRRIEFLVRPGAHNIAKALKVFGDCDLNITEVNLDYVKDLTCINPSKLGSIAEEHNLVECVCTKETREELLTKLKEKYEAKDVQCLSGEDLSFQNIVRSDEDYCVVAFSVFHAVGSLARTLMAFVELNIDVHGVNTLGCADPSTLQQCLKYKRCQMEFTTMSNEKQEELLENIRASKGIVVENAALLSEKEAAANTYSLQLLIEEDKQSQAGIPDALQLVFTIFQKYGSTVTDYSLDCDSCEHQYQKNHVIYTYTNAQEKQQLRLKLIKDLRATGVVKVLDDFQVSLGDNSSY